MIQNYYVDLAAEQLKLNKDLLLLVKTPDRELHVELPIVRDSGGIEVSLGYRVQHNNSRGPNKGGILLSPEITIESTRHLAALMTWKTALADIPFGGSQGAICCNPSKLSPGEVERLIRLYVSKTDCIMGPQIDIPGPDLNTNSQIMAWVLDEYAKLHGFQPACVTGKPLALLGCCGREEAPGYGAIIVLVEAAKYFSIDLSQMQFAIQGFGSVGLHATKILSEMNCKVVAISDSQGGICNKNGIDIPALTEHIEAGGTLEEFEGIHKISNEELITCDCDILITAASNEQINADNAKNIKAKFILEASNEPLTLEAEKILESKNVKIIPDVIASLGGVIASYFEWTQNLQQFRWNEESVYLELEKFLNNSFETVTKKMIEDKVSMRLASYLISAERVALATKLRGYQ